LIFCYGNELEFTYKHLQLQKFFRSLSLAIRGKTEKGQGMGGEEKEREERRRMEKLERKREGRQES
jgi:hypothetical protein